MQQEIQELKKARFNCGNQILLPQLNVKFPMRKLTELSFAIFIGLRSKLPEKY